MKFNGKQIKVGLITESGLKMLIKTNVSKTYI